MASLYGVGKIAFFISLCIFHSIFFGYPAFQRYLDASVSVEEWIEPSHNHTLPAPAVTLCPFEKYFNGWKNTINPTYLNNYDVNCPEASSPEDFVRCLEQKTFNFSETVQQSHQGIGPTVIQNFSSPSSWISDSSVGLSGRCYTLNYTGGLGTDLMDDALAFNLNPDLQYSFYVHQLDFFLLTWNPLTMPTINGNIEQESLGTNWHSLFLKTVRHEKIHRSSAPCNPQPQYRFSLCVKKAVSKRVGCRLPWDMHTSGECFILVCSIINRPGVAGAVLQTAS